MSRSSGLLSITWDFIDEVFKHFQGCASDIGIIEVIPIYNKGSDTYFSWDHCLIHLYFLFYCFFQRIVSCIILPPAFGYRFPFTPYILTLSSRTLPPFAQILPAPSTLRYTLCPHSATFWQPASAYFPVPVSFLFEFPFSFHELHHALLPVP